MSDPFEIGRRVLGQSRRLLAPPQLAGLPVAFASLLQDPGELLEEAWGGLEHGGPAAFEKEATAVRKATPRSRPDESGGAAPQFERPSGGSQFSPLNTAPEHTAARGLLTRVSPPSLPRVASPFSRAPMSKDESAASLRRGRAPGVTPHELAPTVRPAPLAPVAPVAPFAAAPGNKLEPYGTERVYREREKKKVVEWPSARNVTAGGAALAAPGNALQETEERLGADPELLRLRSQLKEDDAKRARLRPARAEEVEGVRATDTQGQPAAGPHDAAPAPTSFSPLTSLLSKNVGRGNFVNASAPLAQGPEQAVPTAGARAGDEAPDWAGESGEGRGGREESPKASAASVDEVLEELYERLRLEFLRTYGTTGG